MQNVARLCPSKNVNKLLKPGRNTNAAVSEVVIPHVSYLSTSQHKKGKVLTFDNMNPRVKEMEYAVRGPIVIRAGEIEEQLKQVVNKGTSI